MKVAKGILFALIIASCGNQETVEVVTGENGGTYKEGVF